MELAALSSGSSGNCFYVGNEKSAVLIDVGISAKQVINRLLQINGNPEKIKAIFITHEHTDHICGADVLARKLKIPIFATKATLKNRFICSEKNLLKEIEKNSTTKIDELKIQAFSKFHSAADPVSYTIHEKKKVSVITDAGIACENICSHISNCDSLFIESNHDELLLENGPYPYYLKKWIKSDGGHLSNKDAALCIIKHASPKLQKIILSHLSKTNNTPDLAFQTFKEIISTRKNFSPEIIVSHREHPTQMFTI